MENIKPYLRKIKKIVKYLFNPKSYSNNIELCGPYCEVFVTFINERMRYVPKKGEIACFSSSSLPEVMRLNRCRYKFFYTGENTHVPWSAWQKWEDCHLWKDAPALSVGFDYYDQQNYLRFPNWLGAIWGYTATKEDIEQFVQEHNMSDSTKRKKQCAFICRNDYFGDRAQIADLVEQVMPISYPSDFRHNDGDMRGKYKDDKVAYLRQFRFNLCPENSNSRGYVTEKIFEAIEAGCVPIYWGNEGYPEPDILNPRAIVYLDKDNPEEGLSLLRKLYTDPKAYAKFVAQARFLPDAADKIYAYYERLEDKLKEILQV